MTAYIEHLMSHSLMYALIIIGVFAFLESVALVGLFFPGTVVMASLGALIGNGNIGFFPACCAGFIGCILADWLSFGIGVAFNAPLRRCALLKKYQSLLIKTENALNEHSFVTILLGRLIGPTRPVISLVAGMLNLPAYKFFFPNLIACLIWSPLYFLPGILAGVAISIPKSAHSRYFDIILFLFVVFFALSIWFSLRFIRMLQRQRLAKENDIVSYGVLDPFRLKLFTPLVIIVMLMTFYLLLKQPLLPIYCRSLVSLLHF